MASSLLFGRVSVPGIAACLPFFLPAAERARAPEEPLNIVLLIADDQDYEHLGWMGSELAHTPALDRLAEEGTAFPTAHVPVARCRPSLAALLSGRWPHQNGIFFNSGPGFLSTENPLPKLLADAGYVTYLGGKFWEGDPAKLGFMHHDSSGPDGFVRDGQEELFAFIDRFAGREPMFIWWAPKLPHLPHDPPERFLERYSEEIPVPPHVRRWRADEFRSSERLQLATTAWLDDGIAQLGEKLRDAGIYDSTLFVYLIDNGYGNGLVSKGSPYEKGVRTPIVFAHPGIVPAGQRVDALASTLDVYPTLLDFAGVPVPKAAAGRSLRPLIEGRTKELRDSLCGAAYRRRAAKGGRPEDTVIALYARTRRWKYVLFLADVPSAEQTKETAFSATRVVGWKRGDCRLYDLEQDPYELEDLSEREEHAESLAQLRSAALEWWRATGGGALDLP